MLRLILRPSNVPQCTRALSTGAAVKESLARKLSRMEKSAVQNRERRPVPVKGAATHASSQAAAPTPGSGSCDFGRLGLSEKLIDATSSRGLRTPTAIQKTIIPLMLNFTRQNFIMSSATGSGKTLAYVLPVMEQLLREEAESASSASGSGGGGMHRMDGCPRCIILTPTRDLASQVLAEVKALSHRAKLSSCGVVGGGYVDRSEEGVAGAAAVQRREQGSHSGGLTISSSFSNQKASLGRKVDIVVATPGKLLQHFEKHNVKFTHVRHVVIDEIDTMLLQGFSSDLEKLLYYINNSTSNAKNQQRQMQKLAKLQKLEDLTAASGQHANYATALAAIRPAEPPRIVMVTATVTAALRKLLQFSSPAAATSSSSLKVMDEFTRSLGSVDGAPFADLLEQIRGKNVAVEDAILPLTRGGNSSNAEAEIAATRRPSFHNEPLLKSKTPAQNDSTAEVINVPLKVIQLLGSNKALPNVTHNHVDLTLPTHSARASGSGNNKLDVLVDVLLKSTQQHSNGGSRYSSGAAGSRTIVFCNTISSCRAVDYHLNSELLGAGSEESHDGGEVVHNSKRRKSKNITLLSYHGDLNSTMRTKNLQIFRDGADEEENKSAGGGHKVLICTDIAARGLDIPDTSHVILFDFPLNSVDYLHRTGRTGRAGRAGLVTALVGKRDKVLSQGILMAIDKNLPLDGLSSDKDDYYKPDGKHHHLLQNSGNTLAGLGFGANASTQTARVSKKKLKNSSIRVKKVNSGASSASPKKTVVPSTSTPVGRAAGARTGSKHATTARGKAGRTASARTASKTGMKAKASMSGKKKQGGRRARGK